MTRRHAVTDGHTDPLSGIVRVFLNSNLSVILILFSLIIGVAVLFITPREEDPQIVVPLADVYVQFPGHTAAEVEQLVSAPLERMLYQIDGVEYVYSMSRDDSAIITVRFYVGEDRERSLVKLFKKLNENADSITPGVTGWVMKPVEIDDVPIVTLAVKGANSDSFALRRVGEELVERLSMIEDVSRSFVVGGQSRTLTVQLDTEKLRSHQLTAVEVSRAVQGANTSVPAGSYTREDKSFNIETAGRITSAAQLSDVVVGVFDARPVFLKDVATVRDGADEVENYVRHGWGIARGFESHAGSPGSVVGEDSHQGHETNEHAARDTTSPNASQTAGLNAVELSPVQPHSDQNSLDSSLAATSVGETFIVGSEPTVTIAISKQKGANAVKVASRVIAEAERLKKEVLPDDVDLVITRNNGLTANHKVNELIEALGIAIVIVVLLLTVGLGWREAVIVSVAVPVVFGLTLAVNLLFGYTINRVTLFALILALGLLVDDPIVDVENIARHFAERKKASRAIVLDAVAEIRPPLISATLAVIVSFLPMFFITGMMGPYMSPMALNVPVAMLMSMIVAFTITPWLTYQMLKAHYPNEESNPELFAEGAANNPHLPASGGHQAAYDPEEIKKTLLYRFFRPLMVPLLKNRFRAISFLLFMGLLTAAAAGLGALRMVPLKMLPFDNKNEFLLVLDMPEGTSLERTDAVVQQIESKIAATPEVTDYTSYVGVAGPIDFNGMVRHYYLRGGAHQAEMRVNFVGKKNRKLQSHGLGLRMRDELTAIAQTAGGKIAIVELPPGPPVLASLVAEVTGQSDSEYSELLDAAATIGRRMEREPGVVEVDDISEASIAKLTFVPDQEKAALAGVSVAAIADTIRIALGGDNSQTIPVEHERTPLRLTFRLPRAARSSPDDLAQLPVKGASGEIVLLAELGKWVTTSASQTIYHKNLQRIAYVFAECAGRPPAECVIDLLADQQPAGPAFVADNEPTPTSSRTYLTNGSGIDWRVPAGINVNFAGEGEWKITLDVFRDLGLAFGAAMVMIYIILVAQTGSFVVPMIVMLAIPLTALGVMPGFYMLNAMLSSPVGGYPDPVFFTATAMIGMIALSGIVTRDSIILVDFMEQSVAAGRPLFDAILESRVVRLRPILLTAGAAMFSAIPITLDPIFSGLGWSLIFGLIASTLFTLFVIPATYWLIYHKRAAH